MRRIIAPARFEKKLRKFLSAHGELRSIVLDIIETLPNDPFTKKYRAHKLSRSLKGSYLDHMEKYINIILDSPHP